jgi:hypothetical protein
LDEKEHGKSQTIFHFSFLISHFSSVGNAERRDLGADVGFADDPS